MVEARKRFLGIELGGARSSRTSIAVIESYPKEEKLFLLDLHVASAKQAFEDSDGQLIQQLKSLNLDLTYVGIHAPMGLPACIDCRRKNCVAVRECQESSVKWARRKFESFLPYSQRPVDAWLRKEFPDLELDDTLGANRAPLAARFRFLQRLLPEMQFLEVLPRLSFEMIAHSIKIPKRDFQKYRKPEIGAAIRLELLGQLSDSMGLFIYEKDCMTIAQNLYCFDALICAISAWLYDRQNFVHRPRGFPKSADWVCIPKVDF